MRWDLTDLALFVHVCQAGSITAGAQQLHLTLASASARVRALETRLHTPLLLRQARGVVPTEAGHTLLLHARQVLAKVDALQAAMAPFSGDAMPRLRVQANTSGLSEVLPRRLPAFLRAHPQVQVETEEHMSPAIADALRAGRCEVGILSDAADLRGLHCRLLRADPLVLAVPHTHALAGSGPITFRIVAGQAFVGLMEEAAQQRLIETSLAADGTPVHWRLRVRALEDVCRMVGEGVGLGVVPALFARRAARRHGLALVALREPWTQRRLMLCTRDADVSPQVQALVDTLAPKRRR